jgi:hypothetical protein
VILRAAGFSKPMGQPKRLMGLGGQMVVLVVSLFDLLFFPNKSYFSIENPSLIG